MPVTHKTKMDIKKTHNPFNAFTPLFNPVFVQYDQGVLKIELSDGPTPYEFESTDSVEFTHVLPDGKVITYPGEIIKENHKTLVIYRYRGSEMAQLGRVQTGFTVLDAERNKVSVQSFDVFIEKSISDAISSPANPEKSLFDKLISDVDELKNNPIGGSQPGPPGEKGDPFEFTDFTTSQLESLRGPQGPPGAPGLPGESGTPTILENTITPLQTTFMKVSDNLIDPNKITTGKGAGFQYRSSGYSSTYDLPDGLLCEEIFQIKNGDSFYSNTSGRLVWYNETGLAEGNASFLYDDNLQCYKAIAGNGVTGKVDGRISESNASDGFWYVCKGTYKGNKTPFGAAVLKSDILSEALATKQEFSSIESRVNDLEGLSGVTFFVPSTLYCYENQVGSKWVPKYNVLASKNAHNFYLENTAPNGALRSDNKLKTQANDQVKLKKSTQEQSNPAAVAQKNYARRSVNPTSKTNPSTVKNMLMIGDSLTDAGFIPCDVKRQITVEHGFSNINFIGTKTDTLNGITAMNEGNGGFSLADYIKTNNSQGRGTTFPNPFLNSGVVSMTNYLSKNNIAGGLDYVVIELGVNDLITLAGTPTTIVASLKTLVDIILADFPNCKIFVCGLLMLAKNNDTYDHVTHNTKALNINKAYEDFCASAAYLNKCIYVDLAVFFDTDYGYPVQNTPYRGSSAQRELVTDWLHPNEAGYYMMADTISSAFIYHL